MKVLMAAAFDKCVKLATDLSEKNYKDMQDNAIAYLKGNYTVDIAYKVIMGGEKK